jgi:hypothetical protein
MNENVFPTFHETYLTMANFMKIQNNAPNQFSSEHHTLSYPISTKDNFAKLMHLECEANHSSMYI